MTDLSIFNPNAVGNPDNNIFGLTFNEQDAQLVLLPVPWEVTVSYNAGTARAPDHIFKASLQIDLFDIDCIDGWKRGIFMRKIDKKILLKSDYLRKEAELFIDYISKENSVDDNRFMCKSLKEINEGSAWLNHWVFEHTLALLQQHKLVGLIGGDHSTPFGFIKALANQHPEFGILQIDAHCDLRKAYEGFIYSHASIMYNVLKEVDAVKKIVQLGIRDYCDEELQCVNDHAQRITTYFDKDIKMQLYEGITWATIVNKIVEQLPQKVYVSFDIDGLDPKLCPNTGTPVHGGFEVEQIFYLIRKLLQSGRKIIGFDLNEVGVDANDWDANVGARVLYKLCNFLLASN